MEGISIAKLLIVGALIVLLFGTNKLRSLGGDLGSAIKGFKKAMSEDDTSAKRTPAADEKPVEQVVHKD
ncbi:twin-arginine translocase subunit TatE [Erwinia oleae]|uniref:twin-arginine translocase subunit TatE n=1 Tax=Erwinia oleae TaxID=796334 RepID=UPI000555927D|nr:twin-arginine translocase subunit TatE [Erwinia oleae]